MLSQALDAPRWAVGQSVREALRLAAVRKGTGFTGGEDAGVIDFRQLRPQDLWALRVRVGEALSGAHPEPKRRLVALRTPRRDLSNLKPGYVSVGEVPERRVAPDAPPPEASGRVAVLQGAEGVDDALIDPARPGEALGNVPRDNVLSKNTASSVFLVRFDLDRLGLPESARVQKATVSLSVWDPSSQGRTKVVAVPLTTPWEETSATWRQPSAGRRWKGGASFALDADAGSPGPPTVIEPDEGTDLADPPREYQIDVTDAVRGWLAGRLPNHGLAIVPVPDRSVDDGFFTRFQVYASESDRAKATPKLTVQWAP